MSGFRNLNRHGAIKLAGVALLAVAVMLHYTFSTGSFGASAIWGLVSPLDSTGVTRKASLRNAAQKIVEQESTEEDSEDDVMSQQDNMDSVGTNGMVQGPNSSTIGQNGLVRTSNSMIGQSDMRQQPGMMPGMMPQGQNDMMGHNNMMQQGQNGMMQQPNWMMMPQQGGMMMPQPGMVQGPNGIMMQQPNVMMMMPQQQMMMPMMPQQQMVQNGMMANVQQPLLALNAQMMQQQMTQDGMITEQSNIVASTDMHMSESASDSAELGAEAAAITTNKTATEEGEESLIELADYNLEVLGNFKDSWEPWEKSDVPIFLHIPRAGGSTVKDVIGTCHRFVMATEYGITGGHGDDEKIAVVYPNGGPEGQDRSPFVNVDTTTVEGIKRAKEMGFADSGLADAVVSSFIYESNELFTPTAQGRLFSVFRHPIDRAISMFYYIQVADWEPSYAPKLKDWTIEQYARSDKIENNWMTRQLANKLEGDLSDDNMKLAMEVLRRKFLVGLMTEIEETMERFERFFHWTYHVNPPNQDKCRTQLLGGGSNKNTKKKEVEEGSEAWTLLAHQNTYDLQLYEYIELLFKEQEQLVSDIPVGFRNINATCCKCGPSTYPPEGFTCPLAILNKKEV